MAKANSIRFQKGINPTKKNRINQDQPWDILKDKRGPEQMDISGDPRISTDLIEHCKKFREDDLDAVLDDEGFWLFNLNLRSMADHQERELWRNQHAGHIAWDTRTNRNLPVTLKEFNDA